MKVFVTGGNGFIGSRVVRRLHARGHAVRCLLREASRTHRIDAVPFERAPGDVRDAASLRAGVAGCDAVIHLASISSWDQIRSPAMREVVLEGTANVLDAARDAGKLRTVFVSSAAAVNGSVEPKIHDERSPFEVDGKTLIYAGLKHEAEKLCADAAAFGLPVVTVNPCEVYGPEDDDLITASYLVEAIRDWPVIAVTGGTAVAHVDDVAAGICAALEQGRPGERYILAGENLTVRAILELALEAAGARKTVLQVPNALAKAAIGALDALRLPTPVKPDLLAYGCLHWWMDASKARAELGWDPRPAKQTIAETVAWLRAAGRI